MTMHIVVVGINHRSAPIDLRERLAIGQEQVPQVLDRLRNQVGLEEAAVLSTCNRVEIYGRVSSLEGAVQRLSRFLSDHGGFEETSLASRLYSHAEPHSVHHLFSVASGLDSMLLGEVEISQQVKHAYELARAHGACGKIFHALFQKALNTAKAVRTHTTISQGATSVGSVSVELAGKIFDPLSKAVVLLVGAGKIGELTLRRIRDRGVRDVRVINRSVDRAVELAALYGARPIAFGQLQEQLAEADIVITSTSASSFLLGRLEAEQAMRVRHHRPLCFIDLGVPRNIDPAVGRLENVYRFDIDDLQKVVSHAHENRRQAVAACHRIIDEKVDRFLYWWQQEQACPPDASYSEAAAAR